jgi:hypothetical protein
LRDLRDRSAGFYWSISLNHGSLTRPELQWIRDTMRAANLDRSAGPISNMKRMLEGTDEQLAAVIALAGREDKTISLRRVELPFLAAHLDRLDIYKPGTQQALLKIATDVRLYNEIVEDVRSYAAMTFNESLSDKNREGVLGNLRQAESRCASTARMIAEEAGTAIMRLAAEKGERR